VKRGKKEHFVDIQVVKNGWMVLEIRVLARASAPTQCVKPVQSQKKRRLCIFPKKRTKIDPCLQYPHVESTTLMTENIESEKHWCDVD
jgi:hypothetical protein